MQGLMQDAPLSIIHLFDRAEQYHGDKTITTSTAIGLEHTNYATWAHRTRRLGGALNTLGISADGRVGTFAWNTARHLELWRNRNHHNERLRRRRRARCATGDVVSDDERRGASAASDAHVGRGLP